VRLRHTGAALPPIAAWLLFREALRLTVAPACGGGGSEYACSTMSKAACCTAGCSICAPAAQAQPFLSGVPVNALAAMTQGQHCGDRGSSLCALVSCRLDLLCACPACKPTLPPTSMSPCHIVLPLPSALQAFAYQGCFVYRTYCTYVCVLLCTACILLRIMARVQHHLQGTTRSALAWLMHAKTCAQF
jgi:hypothetical protein